MRFEETEYEDVTWLARKYASSRQEIKDLLNEFLELGYAIEVLEWGKPSQRLTRKQTPKIKINVDQFRKAMLSELRARKAK